MQCCEKKRRFTHFPFSTHDSLGMPTDGGELQQGQAVWRTYTLRVDRVETSRCVTAKV